jgi:tetratricopeptide (TPR) repeat protein
MTLENAIPFSGKSHAEAKAGWLRAALAVRPANGAAWNRLGDALRLQGDLDGAVAAYREVVRVHPDSAPVARLALGTALQQKGDLEGAAAVYREALRVDPKNYSAEFGMGLCLQDRGDLEGAAAAFREAARLDDEPALQEICQQAEQQARLWQELQPRLADVAAGRAEPKDAADALALAQVCRQPFQKRYALAVRLAEAAFAAQPALADDPAAAPRYHSATAAARVADGKDPALPAPGAEERARLTGLARKWLRADLSLWAAQTRNAQFRQAARNALTGWKNSANLASVRDPASLAAMPPEERKEWAALWADVDALIASVASEAGPTPGKQ